MANQVDFKILPSDQFNVYSPQTRSDKIITYFTLLSKLRGDILAVGGEDDPNDIVSAFYTNTGGTQTLHLVKADGSEITASQAQQVISGTLNFVSKFTSSNDIGDSQIFDNGTNVGIGTTSMTHKLQLGTGGVFADYFQLDTTYSNGFVVGAISWDSDNGTADIGLSGSLKLKVGQDDVWYVKNKTGSSIAKGTAVYASGTLGASSKILITPMIADGTIAAKFFLGIVAETIANEAEGYVLTKGKLRNINTNAYNEGDVLWVSPTIAGALTSTEPTAPDLKLPVAFVVNKGNNGVLAVRATTGQRIKDASDVNYAGTVDNSFLVYDLASGVWVDEAVGIFKTIAVASQDSIVADTYDDTLTLVAGTNVTITTNAGTDTITINSTDEFVGTVTSVAALTLGTAGTDLSSTVANSTTTPVITLNVPTASATNRGALSFTDWTTFNGKQDALTFTAPLVNTSGTITITQSGAATDGYLSSTDWNAFNAKEPALTKGNLTEVTSAVLTITNGANAVIGSGTSIQVAQSSSTTNGYLSSTDWSTFNGKASNSFTTISVATQSSIVADSATDTLTIAAGTGVAITTDALTDTLTISATGSGGTVTSIGTNAPITGGTITGTGTIGITQSGAAADGYLSSTDWNAFNGKQDDITLTTTGTSGAATLIGSTLNIPDYTEQYTGTVTSVAALTLGTTGTDLSSTVANGTTTPVITLNVPTASAANRGALSSTDWTTFNGKASNSFTTIAVSGQTSIVADTATDTLTLAAGTGISLTTNAGTDTLTITNTGNVSISCFSAYSSTGVTLTTDATAYNLNLNTETIKDATVFTHSISADPEEVTVLLTGTYEISYSGILFNANASSTTAAVVDFKIYKNGSVFTDPLNTSQNVAHFNVTNLNYINQISNSYIVSLNANDVIKLVITAAYVSATSPSPAINFGFVGSAKNNLTIKKLA